MGEASTTACKACVVGNRLAVQSLSVQGLQKGAFRTDAPLTQGLYTQEVGGKKTQSCLKQKGLPGNILPFVCTTFVSSRPFLLNLSRI